MTVRFKSQTEYQKSYSVSRSRSVSPQRCAPFAGLRSDQMGIGREPGLQRRKRPSSLGAARSCSSLFCPPDDPAVRAHRRAPTAVSRSRTAHRNKCSPNSKPPRSPGSPAVPETPAGPRPAADPGPPERQDTESPTRPGADGKSVKPHPSEPDSQSQPSRPVTGEAPTEQQQPSVNKVDQTLRPGGHRSEYHRQFAWKKPVTAASPLLTAEQMLYSSSKPVPPFKRNPVSMETEYQKNFRGLVPPTGPRLRKLLEHQRVPLFHTEMSHRGKREETQDKQTKQKTNWRENNRSPPKVMPPPLQLHKRRRMLTEYQSSFRSALYRNPEGGGENDGVTQQVRELRQQARSYRHRAWGTNFCRDHLNQLLSEHNAVWEPTDTTDSHSEPSTPHLNHDLSPEPDGCSTSCVEALDLASNSSKRSSVVGSGERHHIYKKTQRNLETKTQIASQGEGEEEEEESTDEEEGRLPTPRLKTRLVQRTHHDLTTPATGGAMLVGKLKSADDSSPNQHMKCGTSVTMTKGAESANNMLTKHKEAWPENIARYSGPSPESKPASSPPPKPIRMKQASPSPAAPPTLISSPQHVIQGTLRHPDFQHNGELGLRFLPCSRGGCSSDEDDRLSVMSWRSAASCSAASAILERAQKRREDFWGKR